MSQHDSSHSHDHIQESNNPWEMWSTILLLIPLCAVTLWIIVSNAFVMLAVIGFRHMRTPSNVYIASLASTDFLVGLLILPFSILQIIDNQWPLGPVTCKAWSTLDVILSTLSILHLIAIAVDRYRVVSDGVFYLQKRSVADVISVIVCLWCIGIWIATPPVLGWGLWDKIESSERFVCDYSSSLGYVIHSAFGSFIFPGSLMIYIYLKIYHKIQHRLRERERASVRSLECSLDKELSETEAPPSTKENTAENAKRLENARPSTQIQELLKKKIRFSLTKERKAARTLGIIIGAFMICWMPFCIMYILRPIVGDPPVILFHAIVWLGYLNSAVNPLIYCVYSTEYRQVFRRIFCKCQGRSRRGRNV